MLPNLSIMICAYVVFRCIEAMARQLQKESKPGAVFRSSQIAVFVFAVLCMMASIYVTWETVESGLKLTESERQRLRRRRHAVAHRGGANEARMALSCQAGLVNLPLKQVLQWPRRLILPPS
jgi:hypothetical protein